MPSVVGMLSVKKDHWQKNDNTQNSNGLTDVMNLANQNGSQAQVYDGVEKQMTDLSFKQGGSISETNGVVSWLEEDIIPELTSIEPEIEAALPIIEELAPLLLL